MFLILSFSILSTSFDSQYVHFSFIDESKLTSFLLFCCSLLFFVFEWFLFDETRNIPTEKIICSDLFVVKKQSVSDKILADSLCRTKI